MLGAIRYRPNAVYLHRDTAPDAEAQARLGVLEFPPRQWPRRGRWRRRHDLLDECAARQSTPTCPLFVSLNPPFEPKPALTFARFNCDHPQFDAAAFAAQKRLDDIQGANRTWFCGAWTGYGFHEDGLRSGLAVAEQARRRGSVAQAQCRLCGGGRMNQTVRMPMHHRCRSALSRRCHACAAEAGRHRFVYRVLNLLIDLDRLEEADRQSRLFAVNRRALYSFHERDHGPRDGSRSAAYAREAAKAGRHRPVRRQGMAALLSAPARLRLQSAVDLLLLPRRRHASRS